MPRPVQFLDQFEPMFPRVYRNIIDYSTDLDGLLPGHDLFQDVLDYEAWIWDRKFGRLFRQSRDHHMMMCCLYRIHKEVDHIEYDEVEAYQDAHMGFHMSSVSSMGGVYVHKGFKLTAQEKMLFKKVKFISV